MEKRTTFLTPQEVSNLAKVPLGSLANLRSQRRGPKFFRVSGRRVRYRLDDVLAWLQGTPVLTVDTLEEDCEKCKQ